MTAETLVFVVFAFASIAGGIVMVTARNPIYSAMGLLVSMFSVAVFYVLNDAHFIAAVQVLIYAGAVMTLFLFVIMLIGVDKAEDPNETIPLQRPIAVGLGIGLLALLLVAGRAAWVTGVHAGGGEAVNGTIEAISEQLFGAWLIPFEATVLLLTIAAVGTVALAQSGERPVLTTVSADDMASRYQLTAGTGRGAGSLDIVEAADADGDGSGEEPA